MGQYTVAASANSEVARGRDVDEENLEGSTTLWTGEELWSGGGAVFGTEAPKAARISSVVWAIN